LNGSGRAKPNTESATPAPVFVNKDPGLFLGYFEGAVQTTPLASTTEVALPFIDDRNIRAVRRHGEGIGFLGP